MYRWRKEERLGRDSSMAATNRHARSFSADFGLLIRIRILRVSSDSDFCRERIGNDAVKVQDTSTGATLRMTVRRTVWDMHIELSQLRHEIQAVLILPMPSLVQVLVVDELEYLDLCGGYALREHR